MYNATQPDPDEPDWLSWNRQMALKSMEDPGPIAARLMAADPFLDAGSAWIIAGDVLSGEKAKRSVLDGCPAIDAVDMVGSFARLDFAVWAADNRHLAMGVLLDMLPDLWSGSDPDDTKFRYLDLWKAAWRRNGRKAVCDTKPLPRQRQFIVYRGQDADAPLGIAWSLKRSVAEMFARGVGTRQQNRPGIVFETVVSRKVILAFLTGRNEDEIILPTIGTDHLPFLVDPLILHEDEKSA